MMPDSECRFKFRETRTAAAGVRAWTDSEAKAREPLSLAERGHLTRKAESTRKAELTRKAESTRKAAPAATPGFMD